ncbi:MAG: imidazole glycerol phosphate synthase subunit HisF [Microbacteriaceae bacterium]
MGVSLRIIPCLDVANGRIVKGVKFENLRDAGDPIERARLYYQQGADELTFLDVNATIDNRENTYQLVQQTAEELFIPLTVGGGISTVEHVEKLLASGADKVSVSSAAIRRPELMTEISEQFGNQVLVLSLDLKRGPSASGFIVTTHGGRQSTDLDALEWIREAQDRGVGELLVNSIDADGTKAGFDREMLDSVKAIATVPVIASGGAGKIEDFVDVAGCGVDAILAASVFHDNVLTIPQVKSALSAAGYSVRNAGVSS